MTRGNEKLNEKHGVVINEKIPCSNGGCSKEERTVSLGCQYMRKTKKQQAAATSASFSSGAKHRRTTSNDTGPWQCNFPNLQLRTDRHSKEKPNHKIYIPCYMTVTLFPYSHHSGFRDLGFRVQGASSRAQLQLLTNFQMPQNTIDAANFSH